MQTKSKLTLCVIVSMGLTACTTPTSSTETSKSICVAWKEHLVDPSRNDTPVSAKALNSIRINYEAACLPFSGV